MVFPTHLDPHPIPATLSIRPHPLAVIAWLKEDVKKHVESGKPARAHVMQLAPLIGDWILNNNKPGDKGRGGVGGGEGISLSKMAAALVVGVAVGVAIGRAS